MAFNHRANRRSPSETRDEDGLFLHRLTPERAEEVMLQRARRDMARAGRPGAETDAARERIEQANLEKRG